MDKESLDYLGDIIEESKESREFIIDLLKYSKSIYSFNDDSELVNMVELMNRIVKKIAPPNNYQLVIHDDLPELYLPRIALRHVFGNLIENAVKYNENDKPKIIIKHESHEDYYDFIITDNGKGIEPDLLRIIRKLFGGNLDSDSKFIKSIGLGLAIVNKLVMLMGGVISVQSIVGSGTEYTIRLPQNTLI